MFECALLTVRPDMYSLATVAHSKRPVLCTRVDRSVAGSFPVVYKGGMIVCDYFYLIVIMSWSLL